MYTASHCQSSLTSLRIALGGKGMRYSTFVSLVIYGFLTGSALTQGTVVPTGNLNSPRYHHSATLLQDGKVLITGSYYQWQSQADAEVYDPSTGAFSLTGEMLEARHDHSAILLPDGKVLIAGGYEAREPAHAYRLDSAELYDPVTGTFSTTGIMSVARHQPNLTLLENGKILVTGGNNTTVAEIYDPATGVFSPTGSLQVSRSDNSATLLPDGRVLIAGGNTLSGPTGSMEIFDPITEEFSETVHLNWPRGGHRADRRVNGQIVITGGKAWSSLLSTAELFSTEYGVHTTDHSFERSRGHNTVMLPNGDILIAHSTGFLEIFQELGNTFRNLGDISKHGSGATATRLKDGRVLLAGGSDGVYSAQLFSWSFAYQSIGSLQPRYGPPGTRVSILGYGFEKETVEVAFDGVPSPKTTIFDNHLIFTTVPNLPPGQAVVSIGSTPDPDYYFNVTEPGIDLAVVPLSEPEQVPVGDQFTLRITVSNNGVGTATGVTLSVDLPVYDADVISTNVPYTRFGNSLVLEVGILLENATSTVEIIGQPIQDTTIFSNVSVTADQHDPVTYNNSSLLYIHAFDDPPKISSILPRNAYPGTRVLVTGNGFSRPGLTVQFNEIPGTDPEIIDDSTLLVTTPSGLQEGKVEISVSNDRGESVFPYGFGLTMYQVGFNFKPGGCFYKTAGELDQLLTLQVRAGPDPKVETIKIQNCIDGEFTDPIDFEHPLVSISILIDSGVYFASHGPADILQLTVPRFSPEVAVMISFWSESHGGERDFTSPIYLDLEPIVSESIPVLTPIGAAILALSLAILGLIFSNRGRSLFFLMLILSGVSLAVVSIKSVNADGSIFYDTDSPNRFHDTTAEIIAISGRMIPRQIDIQIQIEDLDGGGSQILFAVDTGINLTDGGFTEEELENNTVPELTGLSRL